MYPKLLAILLLITIAFCQQIKAQKIDEKEDLDDFNFDGKHNSTTDDDVIDDLSDFDNEVEDEPENSSTMSTLQKVAKMKEELVKGVIVNTMKNDDMKKSLAQMLPIIRVMSQQQKLALATLVTNQVLTPKDNRGLSIQQVNTMFAGKNPNMTSELMLPIALDIANLFRKSRHLRHISDMEDPSSNEITSPPEQEKPDTEKDKDDEEHEEETTDEPEDQPEAQELRAGPMFHRRNRPHPAGPHSVKILPTGPYRRNTIEKTRFRKPAIITKLMPSGIKDTDCDQFTNGICLDSPDYPRYSIMASIRRNKEVITHLLAEFKDMNNLTTTEDGVLVQADRRTGADGDEKGFMCPSTVKYARPKKARSTSGQWKYIVNTEDHTQTLRLEKCLKPLGTCSYLTDNFKSKCMQVYNYHRLLTWDKTNGLHMDIFKVPTCCSCHIEGYKTVYPPYHPSTERDPELFPGEDFGPDPAPNIDPNLIFHGADLNPGVPFDDPDHIHASSSNQKNRYGIITKTTKPTQSIDPNLNSVYNPIPSKSTDFANHQPNPADVINLVQQPNGHSNTFNHVILPNHPSKGVVNSVPEYNIHSAVITPVIDLTHINVGPDRQNQPQNELSHYLEAPKPQTNSFPNRQTPSFVRTNNFKRGVVSSSSSPSIKLVKNRGVTQIPKRNYRRPPVRTKNSDQEGFGSNVEATRVTPPQTTTHNRFLVTTQSTPRYSTTTQDNRNRFMVTTTPSSQKKDAFTKRVNYNYHPIIDFFEPVEQHHNDQQPEIQKRIDTNHHFVDATSGGWRPVAVPHHYTGQNRRTA